MGYAVLITLCRQLLSYKAFTNASEANKFFNILELFSPHLAAVQPKM
jgi:hypothetical protein